MQVHQIFTANCLNPCCNGIYLIIQVTIENIMSGRASLNPCCNGIYLIIEREYSSLSSPHVGLNPCCNGIYLIILFLGELPQGNTS